MPSESMNTTTAGLSDPSDSARAGDATAHTPGPWKVRKGFRKGCWEVYPVRKVSVGQPSEVAEVNDIYDEHRANAKLIAAAPDLLHAILMLLDDVAPGNDLTCWAADSSVAAARRAVAKATP